MNAVLGPASPFVGRERELDELVDRLARGERLLTLTGVGGIGKSALGAELCARLAREEGAQALRVDLSDATTEEALIDAVAVAVEAGPAGKGEGDGWLVRALAARGTSLLVLDPLDRLVSQAPVLSRWLAGAPELSIVAVSRERLGAAGEHVYELGPLPIEGQGDEVGAAVELFIAAVRSVRTDYQPGAQERGLLTEIATELDGMPLALLLAAPRMAVMGAAPLLHRLRSRFEILRRPGAKGRHGTLEASLAWSWEVLEKHEREALAQCTVFRGGFTLEAAEAVLELGEHSALEVIERLRAKSLVRAAEAPDLPGELRLSLYQSVAAFGAAHVGDRKKELEARHANFHVERAEQWAEESATLGGDAARMRLLAERENLLAVVERILGRSSVSARTAELALRALVALWPVLALRGPLEVFARHLERALEVTAGSGADPRLQGRGLAVRGSVRRERGDLERAERDLAEALVIAHHSGDAALEGRALVAVAQLVARRGDFGRAFDGIGRALELARAAGDDAGEVRALAVHGALAARSGKRGEARQYLERGLVKAHALRSAVAEAPILRSLALVALHEGELEEARAHAASALALSERLTDRRGAGLARTLAALAEHVAGELDVALECYAGARAALLAAGYTPLAGVVDGLVAIVSAERGDRAEARLLLASARAAADKIDRGLAAFFALALARIEEVAGRSQSAQQALAQACELLPSEEDAARGADPSLREIADALREGAIDAQPSSPSLAAALLVRLRPHGPRSAPPRALEDAAGALRVGEGGAWFRAPEGERVELSRRKNLRLILARLAHEHEAAPGHALAWDELLEAGWPGEKMRADAGAHRVRVAISTLRKLGLAGPLMTNEEGYLLDPHLAVLR